MTNTAGAPRRFSADQVLAVFATAGTSAPPLTTREIAETCRKAVGFKHGWRDDVPGTADVSKTLAALVADGRLVTSRAPVYRGGDKQWAGDDEQHRHLILRGNGAERFYATPEQSAAWQAHLDEVAREDVRAADLAAEIGHGFESSPHPVTDEQVQASTRYAARPSVTLRLTVEQATHLAECLRLGAGA